MAIESRPTQAWLDALPAGEYFFAHEVPGKSGAVRSMLSRAAADPSNPIRRERQGFYLKLWHQDDEQRVPHADSVYGALKIAGPGGGGASAFALNWLGWTLQHPCVYHFAVAGRPPTSPWGYIRFVRRSNLSRLDLTWAEVTLIEGIRDFGLLECVRWGEALDMLIDGKSQLRLGPEVRLRPAEIRRVGALEQNQQDSYYQRLSDACNALDAASAR